MSAYGLSDNNNNGDGWWMWTAIANFRRARSPSRSAWSEGWRPPGAQSTYFTERWKCVGKNVVSRVSSVIV